MDMVFSWTWDKQDWTLNGLADKLSLRLQTGPDALARVFKQNNRQTGHCLCARSFNK